MSKTDRLYADIKDVIEDMNSSEIIALHNDYCDAARYYDNRIEDMEYFDECFADTTPMNIALCIFCGHGFNPNDDYFMFDGYGNVCSFRYWDDPNSPIDIDDIIKYIIRTGEDLGVDEIAELLDAREAEEIARAIDKEYGEV